MLADWLERTFQLGGGASPDLHQGDPALADRIEALYRARDLRHPRLVEAIQGVRRLELAAGQALAVTTELLTVITAELQRSADRQRPKDR